jgi:hypothetical protein
MDDVDGTGRGVYVVEGALECTNCHVFFCIIILFLFMLFAICDLLFALVVICVSNFTVKKGRGGEGPSGRAQSWQQSLLAFP